MTFNSPIFFACQGVVALFCSTTVDLFCLQTPHAITNLLDTHIVCELTQQFQ